MLSEQYLVAALQQITTDLATAEHPPDLAGGNDVRFPRIGRGMHHLCAFIPS